MLLPRRMNIESPFDDDLDAQIDESGGWSRAAAHLENVPADDDDDYEPVDDADILSIDDL